MVDDFVITTGGVDIKSKQKFKEWLSAFMEKISDFRFEVLESVPELLSQVALRVAALKTLEGALLSLMLSERIATKGLTHAASKLLGARELAELFGVPESWVREQARLGILPSFKLGHYVRFRIEEVERFLAQRASQAA